MKQWRELNRKEHSFHIESIGREGWLPQWKWQNLSIQNLNKTIHRLLVRAPGLHLWAYNQYLWRCLSREWWTSVTATIWKLKIPKDPIKKMKRRKTKTAMKVKIMSNQVMMKIRLVQIHKRRNNRNKVKRKNRRKRNSIRIVMKKMGEKKAKSKNLKNDHFQINSFI